MHGHTIVKLIGLVWFGLFVHQFSHTCNTGHVSYRLQFVYYNTSYNILTPTQYYIINNNTKFKDQLEVEFVPTASYVLYKYNQELRIQIKSNNTE